MRGLAEVVSVYKGRKQGPGQIKEICAASKISRGLKAAQPTASMLVSSLLGLSLAVVAQGKYIVPGGRWRDTDGELVNAHAGGVLFDDKTEKFWWFGEYKIEGQEEGGGVSVYSSDDLATWEAHGLALSVSLSPRKFICLNIS